MAAATPMAGTANDPYGGFANWNVRSATTPIAVPESAPAFGGRKQSSGDAKINAPSNIDPSTTGKRSNALAQYSRVVAASGDMRNRVYDDLAPHCVLFASRAVVDAPGNAYDRLSKVLGIRGVNAELAKHTFTNDELLASGIDLTGRLPDREDGVSKHCVRAPTWGYELEKIDKQGRRELRNMQENWRQRYASLQEAIKTALSDDNVEEEEVEKLKRDAAAAKEAFMIKERNERQKDLISPNLRGALLVLDEWRFDGVIQTSELKEARYGELGTSHMLFNVGIRGPSLLRNGSSNGVRYGYGVGAPFPWSHPAREEEEEASVFDAEIRPRHDLLICLHLLPVQSKSVEESERSPRLRFVYRYTSTRRMWKAAALAQVANAAVDAKNQNSSRETLWKERIAAEKKLEAANPDLLAMRSVVGAWRVGSVIDAKASVAPNEYGAPTERSVQVQASVDGSWVGLYELRERYGTVYNYLEDGPEGADAVDQMRMVLGSNRAWKECVEAANRRREACLDTAQDEKESVYRNLYQLVNNTSYISRNDLNRPTMTKLMQTSLSNLGKQFKDWTEALLAVDQKGVEGEEAVASKRRIRNKIDLAFTALKDASHALDTEIKSVEMLIPKLNKEINAFEQLKDDDELDPAAAFAQAEQLVFECVDQAGAVVQTNVAVQKTKLAFAAWVTALQDFNVLSTPPAAPSMAPSSRTMETTVPPSLALPVLDRASRLRMLNGEIDEWSKRESNLLERVTRQEEEEQEAGRQVKEKTGGLDLSDDERERLKKYEDTVKTAKARVEKAWADLGSAFGNTKREAEGWSDDNSKITDEYRLETIASATNLTLSSFDAVEKALQKLEESVTDLTNFANTIAFTSRPIPAPLSSNSVAATAAMVRPVRPVVATASVGSGPFSDNSSNDEDGDFQHDAAVSSEPVTARAMSPTSDDDVVVMPRPPPPPPPSSIGHRPKNPRARTSKAKGPSKPLAP